MGKRPSIGFLVLFLWTLRVFTPAIKLRNLLKALRQPFPEGEIFLVKTVVFPYNQRTQCLSFFLHNHSLDHSSITSNN